MKVLLTHPVDRNPLLVSDDLGLGYLATALRGGGSEVKLELRSLKKDEFTRELEAFRPEVVGIKTFCTSAPAVNETIKLIRKVLPGARCVIGGPQVNAAPESILSYIDADAAFHGDGERSFPAYVNALASGGDPRGISGFIYRKKGKIHVNRADLIRDLDSMGMPAWDLMPPHRGGQLQLSRYSPTASVITSRGCNGLCTFCSEAGGALRFRSPELVLRELFLLRDRYKVREIMFQDSNFLAVPGRIETLCDMMLERGLNLPWSVPYGTRAETLTPDLLKLMKRAGCYRVSIGVETGSPRWQRKLRKNIDLDRLRERIKSCRKSGVEIMANFMYGFPGESRAEQKETVRLALELDVDYVSFYTFAPYPGSLLYDELIDNGVIKAGDFEQFDKFDYMNDLSESSPRELFWLIRRSLFRFYIRPRSLRMLIKNLRYPNLYSIIFKLLYYEFLFPHRTQQHAY